MDRREFLKTTTVAAAAATSTATVATGALAAPTAMIGASPARAAGAREFILAVPQSLDHIEIMTAAYRMAARLETLFAGARHVTITTTVESGFEAIQTSRADAYFGLDSQHAHQHPAFALLSSAPIGEHMDGPTQHAWLASHREPWHALAAEFGAIAFPAFHTGPSGGLYAERMLDTVADVKGCHIAARGLTATMLGHLGANAQVTSDTELTAGISTGRLIAAEPLMAPTSAVAHWSYQPGLTPGGHMLSLGLRTSTWAMLSPAEQAAIEGVAASSYLQSQADAQLLQATVRRLDGHRRWPLHTGFNGRLQADLEAASAATLDDLGSHDATSRRWVAAFRAFRSNVGSDRLRILV